MQMLKITSAANAVHLEANVTSEHVIQHPPEASPLCLNIVVSPANNQAGIKRRNRARCVS
jgi:hypothetical protein